MKIVTLNCANYDDHPDWMIRKRMIADGIVELQPDLVFLQEIRFDPSKEPTNTDYLNMGEQITDELILRKMFFETFFSNAQYYSPITYFPSEYPTPIYEGLSILTNRYYNTWKHTDKDAERKISTLYLPLNTNYLENKDQNRRITQHIEWHDPDIDQTVNIFNTHFSFDKPEMMSNIDHTLKYCANFERNIIVGDMNGLYDQIKKPFEDAGYTDLWTLVHPDEPGYTFPSNSPAERIDYCWISTPLLSEYKSKQIETILSDPNEKGIYASDHMGLFIELV